MTNVQIAGAILPLDLITEVLSYMNEQDASLVSLSCKWWQQLVKEDHRLSAQIARNSRGDLPLKSSRYTHMPWAAGKGYLAILQYALSHGCPWGSPPSSGDKPWRFRRYAYRLWPED